MLFVIIIISTNSVKYKNKIKFNIYNNKINLYNIIKIINFNYNKFFSNYIFIIINKMK